MKKITLILILLTMLLGGCASTIYTAETTYTVPAVPASEGEDLVYETMTSGTYIIGQSPSEYVTGEEVEFTTSQSGKYVAGVDFPAGTYDLVAVEGSGNVFSSGNSVNTMGLNVIMGEEDNEFYTGTYDNYTFEEGEELEVSGVSLKLVPQTEDTFVIEPGTYNLEATKGSGNVFADDLNEMMSATADEFYVDSYDNYGFVEGEVLEVSGVSLKISGKTPPTEAIDAFDVEETLEYNLEPSEGEPTEVCTTDVSGSIEEVECSELQEYDALKADIDSQMSEDQ